MQVKHGSVVSGRVAMAARRAVQSPKNSTRPYELLSSWIFRRSYDYGENSTGPVIPIPLAYPSSDTSNIFLLFGGTNNVTSSSSSWLIHTPSTNFGFGVETATKRQNGGRSM